MWLIYLPAVLIVLYYALYYYFTRTFNYWKKRNVKGPKPIAFFGNLKETAYRRTYMGNLFHQYYNSFPNEKVVGIYRMTTPCLLIRDLDVIKHIMIKDFELFKDRGIDYSNKGLANNLFHQDGTKWSILRSQFNPIFTPGKLKNMFHLLNERAGVFINHMHKQCQANPECEVYSLVRKYSISTIFACAFGVDFDAFEGKIDATLDIVDAISTTPNYVMEFDMMYPGFLRKLNPSLFPPKVTHFFKKLVTDIISERDGKPSARGDFIDLIINLRQVGRISNLKMKEGPENQTLEITDDIIAGQAYVFYVGGHETSTITMAYLLYQLALNPEIQHRLSEEIDSIMTAHNGEITYESLNQMKYLEQIFCETLRMYPILDPLQRKARVDYTIPDTDVVIEKDQTVLIPVTGIHYDEKHYPNPLVFDPDRFDPELVRARHPCAFLPFGVGPRNCIGLRFGSIQSRLCIAKIISKFRVETCQKTTIPIATDPNRIVIMPKNGIFLNMVPR